MNKHDFKIERTIFGRLADSIYSPHTPVFHILHLRDHSRLTTLASLFADLKRYDLLAPANISMMLDSYLGEDSVRVCSSLPAALGRVRSLTRLWEIPRLATCYVIRLPPFYLAYTPGLFEGKLALRNDRLKHMAGPRMKV